MATREAGITLVSLGKPQMINRVKNTKANKILKDWPVNHAPSESLNCSNCEMKIMMAKPLTNPKMTG